MLGDLRKIIEAEQHYDEMLELMMEAANDSIADMFIEDDGEAEIDEKEVVAILAKIPAYDEEEAMTKKLDKITECYIPEELTYVKESSEGECPDDEYVEEGFKELLGKFKRSLTKSGRAANAHDKHLENIRKGMTNELNHTNNKSELEDYKQWVTDCLTSCEEEKNNMEDKNQKDVMDNHINWLKKLIVIIDGKMESVKESSEGECPDDEYVEEGFKELLGKMGRCFTKNGRIQNDYEKILEKSRKGMKQDVRDAKTKEQLEEYKQWLENGIKTNEEVLPNEEDQNVKAVMTRQNEWLKGLLEEVNKKLSKITEGFNPEDEYLEEGFKDMLGKIKSLFNKASRAEAKEVKKVRKDIEESKRVFMLTLHECDRRAQCITFYDELLVVVERYKELAENDTIEDRAKLIQDYCDWIEKFLKEIDAKIKILRESTEVNEDKDYVEEGLFSKKTEVEVEIIYNDWEAHCSVYEVGADDRCLKSISIDLPEEFHAGNNKKIKGDWGTALINYVKKATKKEFKEYKIKRYFIH